MKLFLIEADSGSFSWIATGRTAAEAQEALRVRYWTEYLEIKHLENRRKNYHIQLNVGRTKYLVSHYDGVKQFPDGSAFYDATICNTRAKLDLEIERLEKLGYVQRGALYD